MKENSINWLENYKKVKRIAIIVAILCFWILQGLVVHLFHPTISFEEKCLLFFMMLMRIVSQTNIDIEGISLFELIGPLIIASGIYYIMRWILKLFFPYSKTDRISHENTTEEQVLQEVYSEIQDSRLRSHVDGGSFEKFKQEDADSRTLKYWGRGLSEILLTNWIIYGLVIVVTVVIAWFFINSL